MILYKIFNFKKEAFKFSKALYCSTGDYFPAYLKFMGVLR